MKNTVRGFKLGAQATDGLTGFTGTIVERSVHFNGCIHYHIAPKGLNGAGGLKPGIDIDDQRVQCLFTQEYELPDCEIGDEVVDSVSGMEGYVMGYLYKFSGTIEVAVTSKLIGEETPHTYYFQLARLTKISSSTPQTDSVSVKTRPKYKPKSPMAGIEKAR